MQRSLLIAKRIPTIFPAMIEEEALEVTKIYSVAGELKEQVMNSRLIKEHCSLDRESMRIMEKAYERYKFSARSYYKFLRVARTFADFDGSAVIRRQDVINALMSRDLEKEECGLVVVQH